MLKYLLTLIYQVTADKRLNLNKTSTDKLFHISSLSVQKLQLF